jgi:hypothetical protein
MRRTAAPGSRSSAGWTSTTFSIFGIEPAASSQPCDVRGHVDEGVLRRLIRREVAAEVPASIVVLRAFTGEHAGTLGHFRVKPERSSARDPEHAHTSLFSFNDRRVKLDSGASAA